MSEARPGDDVADRTFKRAIECPGTVVLSTPLSFAAHVRRALVVAMTGSALCGSRLDVGALGFPAAARNGLLLGGGVPGLHRWHHSTDWREGNHNYGAVLSCWDLVFRSFFRPRGRDLTGAVGIGALPRFPARYLAQQLSPFRWSRIRAGNG